VQQQQIEAVLKDLQVSRLCIANALAAMTVSVTPLQQTSPLSLPPSSPLPTLESVSLPDVPLAPPAPEAPESVTVVKSAST